MRYLLVPLVLAGLLSFPLGAAGQQAAKEKGSEAKAVDEAYVGEACFGDSYETDEEVNEGNTISDEEIRLILDRLIS